MKVLQPKKLSANHGWQWINHGVRYFFPAKFIWMSILFLVGVSVFTLIQIAPIFQLALIFIMPFIAVGLSIACADIEQGKKMSINYLIEGFKNPNRLNIFRYGLMIILLMLIAQILSSFILNLMGVSNDQLLAAIEQLKNANEPSLTAIFSSPVLTKYFIITLLILSPVLIINLLSPIILAFTNYTPITAIKLSIKAGWQNLPAFLTYALVFVGLILLIVFSLKFIIAFLLNIFGENSSIALIIYMIIFSACVTILASMSYCSAYVAFKDLFIEEIK